MVDRLSGQRLARLKIERPEAEARGERVSIWQDLIRDCGQHTSLVTQFRSRISAEGPFDRQIRASVTDKI